MLHVIFTYIWLKFLVHVGKHSIHGPYGMYLYLNIYIYVVFLCFLVEMGGGKPPTNYMMDFDRSKPPSGRLSCDHFGSLLGCWCWRVSDSDLETSHFQPLPPGQNNLRETKMRTKPQPKLCQSPCHPCMVHLPTFGYIWLILEVNVGEYTIHGWYGKWLVCFFIAYPFFWRGEM